MRCTYCGSAYGDTRDHVIPVSYTSLNRHFRGCETVPACQECNCLLGSRMYTDVPSRAAYLKNKYIKRYKLNERPEWDDGALSELGPTLRTCVELGLAERSLARARVNHLELVAI